MEIGKREIIAFQRKPRTFLKTLTNQGIRKLEIQAFLENKEKHRKLLKVFRELQIQARADTGRAQE